MATAWECVLTGTGTSVGVPQVGCGCAVCRSTDPRNRRLRTSALLREARPAEVERSGRSTSDREPPPGVAPPERTPAPASDRSNEPAAVVVDPGMDFRQQMLAAGVRRLDGLVVTHDHVDHVGGLDDVRPYCHYQRAVLPVRGAAAALDALRRRYDYIWNPPQEGGGLPRVRLEAVDGPFDLAGLRFTPLPAMHGVVPVLGYRVGDLGYLTDASSIPESTYAALAGVRWLVLGAVQWSRHLTHFNVDEAVAAARRIGAERTYFTHMNHQLDHADLAARLPPGIEPGFDGLTLPVEV